MTQEIDVLRNRRNDLLASGRERAIAPAHRGRAMELGENRANVLARLEENRRKLKTTAERIDDLTRYRSDLADELDRIARAEDAGLVLADLKITHCPACDQAVSIDTLDDVNCFLCHQVLPDEPIIEELGSVRLRFEQDRLSGELKEADELLGLLRREKAKLDADTLAAEESMRTIENELIPARQAVAALVQEEVSTIDMALGQASERERQLGRIASALEVGENLTQRIVKLEIPAARSRVLQLDQSYIVVERYDRLLAAPGSRFVRRIHQEDMCQALGLLPSKKYQEEGGPGIAAIVTLIRRVSSQPETDVDRFLQANMLNWFIGGTDAHAKNYSFLIGAADEIRLAPLYDISSQLPYPELVAQRVSMKIGEHYDIARVRIGDWRKLARACAVPEDRVLDMLAEIARALPDHISAARDQAIRDGLEKSVVAQLAKQVLAHVRERSTRIAMK